MGLLSCSTQIVEHPYHNGSPTEPEVSSIVLQPAEVWIKGHIGVVFWNWAQATDNRKCQSSETGKQCYNLPNSQHVLGGLTT